MKESTETYKESIEFYKEQIKNLNSLLEYLSTSCRSFYGNDRYKDLIIYDQSAIKVLLQKFKVTIEKDLTPLFDKEDVTLKQLAFKDLLNIVRKDYEQKKTALEEDMQHYYPYNLVENNSEKDLDMKEEGKKRDKNKIKPGLIPAEYLQKLAEVLTYGASLYGEDNWKNLEIDRIYNALMRHLIAYRQGKVEDEESNFNHIDLLCANVMMLWWLENEKLDEEDEDDL